MLKTDLFEGEEGLGNGRMCVTRGDLEQIDDFLSGDLGFI